MALCQVGWGHRRRSPVQGRGNTRRSDPLERHAQDTGKADAEVRGGCALEHPLAQRLGWPSGEAISTCQRLRQAHRCAYPWRVPGALLHIGAMHTRQGDGEVCGVGGIEAGDRVRIRCELADLPSTMTWPRITDETHIMVVAQARTPEGAFRIALEEMVIWMEDD